MKKIIILLALIIVQPVFSKNKVTNSMNELYQELINDHNNQPAYIQKVKDAQKKWNEFLEAQVELMYPLEGLGTLQYSCRELYQEYLDRVVMNETKYLFYSENGSP